MSLRNELTEVTRNDFLWKFCFSVLQRQRLKRNTYNIMFNEHNVSLSLFCSICENLCSRFPNRRISRCTCTRSLLPRRRPIPPPSLASLTRKTTLRTPPRRRPPSPPPRALPPPHNHCYYHCQLTSSLPSLVFFSLLVTARDLCYSARTYSGGSRRTELQCSCDEQLTRNHSGLWCRARAGYIRDTGHRTTGHTLPLQPPRAGERRGPAEIRAVSSVPAANELAPRVRARGKRSCCRSPRPHLTISREQCGVSSPSSSPSSSSSSSSSSLRDSAAIEVRRRLCPAVTTTTRVESVETAVEKELVKEAKRQRATRDKCTRASAPTPTPTLTPTPTPTPTPREYILAGECEIASRVRQGGDPCLAENEILEDTSRHNTD